MNLSLQLPPPLSLQTFYVLLCLVRVSTYAYDIKQQIAKDSLGSVIVADGTLYPLLGRLCDEGFIDMLDEQPAGRSGQPRMHYSISSEGLIRLKEELQRLKYAVKIGEANQLLDNEIPLDIQRLLNQ